VTLELEASRVLAAPAAAGEAVRAAFGAWSGVIAIPHGLLPTVIVLTAVLSERLIGVT